MCAKKQLSKDVRGAIIALHNCGKSQGQIAKELNIAKSTVNLWVSRAKNNEAQTTPSPKKRSGRPRKTNLRTDILMKRLVVKNPTITAKELKFNMKNLLSDVAERTIQNRLQKELGLPSRHAAKKPFINEIMRQKRVAFCKKYINWTVEDWKKVLFSDESTFLTFRSCPKKVRRPIGSNRMDPRYTQKTMKHPPSVMVWGCFSFQGRGNLYFLPKNETMNGTRYLAILEEKLPVVMTIHETVTFMHDGAPCHRAKKVSKWLADNNFDILDWPGNSPDLNPIENLWKIIKDKVEFHETGSTEKLKEAIKKVWCNEISTAVCQNLIKSMPKRLYRVIKSKGQMTKY